MGTRLEFQDVLEEVLGTDKVFFQAPPDHLLSYPCIIYNRSNIRSNHADNIVYGTMKRYTVTVIDSNPDSLIPDRVSNLSTSLFDRQFVKDNLYHDVFVVYF